MTRMERVAAAAAFIFVILLSTGAVPAQERRPSQPGQFDFYVLALSWSPSFCEASEERKPGSAPAEQCGSRPYSFVVHGLWPQYEKGGYPDRCQVPAPRLNRATASSMLDLMPSMSLIFHEWDRHGTCTGLEAKAYFDLIRKARAAIKIPANYLEPQIARETTPGDLEKDFIAANPGLAAGAISVTCDSKRVSEIRICLSKDLGFHDCAELERRSCQRAKLAMPAARVSGGPAAAR